MEQSDERVPYPQVDVFAALMRRELDANRHKGDWRYLTTGYLLSEVIGHVAKLSHAIEAGDRDATLEHAADVANLSMMVADRSAAGPLVAAVSGRNETP